MNSHSTLFDSLQREFCPPLDSSLLAALVADLESDAKGNTIPPSPSQVDELRIILRELSTHADETQLFESAGLESTSPTDDTSSTPDFYRGNTATSSSLGSDLSDLSQRPFSSPLGFLQAVLPHISTSTLCSALKKSDGEDFDMWDIIAGILTEEAIKEMEERGLEGLDSDDNVGMILEADETNSWEIVEAKKKTGRVKKKNNRKNTIPLIDVRQQQHVRPKLSGRPRTDTTRSIPAPDPWTQISSLSSHLETLLPPHPASFFQSYFHSPDYATPYQALCSCLSTIYNGLPKEYTQEYTATLFTLLDIILPEYTALDPEQRSRLISDAELSLQATEGRGDDALDLIQLLRDLDSDSMSARFEMGIYHVNPPSPTRESKHRTKQPTVTPLQLPSQSRPKGKPPPATSTSNKTDPFEWQFVPRRKTATYGPHPLANHIPTYARGQKNTLTGGQGFVGELSEHRLKMNESMRKRNELLQEASRMWQRGNVKTRGGEIAFYFAEKAREFQELARNEALNAARAMVESKRLASQDQATVDLHGTTSAEAIVIVKEILQTHGSSPIKPLKIITGRGAHSVNRVSVLKPAVKKALVEDGWTVSSWDGGLVVRGKRAGA